MSKHAMTSKKASQVKRKGHKREEIFHERFGEGAFLTNYSGASADNYIRRDHPLREDLKKVLDINSNSVSLKGGNTIQIHLGNLPELTNKEAYKVSKLKNGNTCVDHQVSFEEQEEQLRSSEFWGKYLKKGDMLAYNTANDRYIFFNMNDVISFICKECKWRMLPTGRLKGDFYNPEKGKEVQYLTYEYRRKKRSFVLGAHGGQKGKDFIELLRQRVPFHEITWVS